MMRRGITWAALLGGALLAACVPQRKYDDLMKTHSELAKKQADCAKHNTELTDSLSEAHKNGRMQKQAIDELNRDTTVMGVSNRKLNSLYKQVNEAYEKLLEKVKELEAQNKLRSQELTAELLDAQKKLREREEDLEKRTKNAKALENDLSDLKKQLTTLQTDLEQRQKRVQELETVLNQKDSVVKALKNTVSNALLGFKDKGLSVNIKNGKVYVSLEEKLLFESGKYAVNATGKQALLQIAEVLGKEADVNVLVEGHTDNVPYKGSGSIKDNWDLSVLRATEVVRIMTKEGKLSANRVTAAGRGDTQPIQGNETPEGRAKNRRTEVILTPQLGELFKILE